MTIIITVLSVSGITEKGSLITSGSMSLYITYLTYSGMISSPNSSCNKYYNANWVEVEELIV